MTIDGGRITAIDILGNPEKRTRVRRVRALIGPRERDGDELVAPWTRSR